MLTEEEKAKASENPDTYIDIYLNKRFPKRLDEEDRLKKALRIYVGNGNSKNGSKYLYGLSYGTTKHPNRVMMFKVVLALEMNEEEALNFLSMFGITPAYNDPSEQCIMSCIRLGIFNMNSIDTELRSRRLKPLFR